MIYYAAKEGNTTLGTQARTTAKGLLDRLLLLKDSRGVAVPETRADYNRFDDVWSSSNQQGLYIPSGYSGTMPNGDVIQPGSTFLSIRSFYEDDPDWPKVQEYLDGGEAPTFTYHRFWAQADFAMALADYGTFFPNG
ncbi:glycoside hydrolase family 48 protein [Thermocatellispora tengchongensis]|uniref:glycoside hydrolase family 48 protein n=1 Tax=Thermocatellispora tengchongensis TaxID=1073253 RepID=UPI003638ED78